MTVGELIEQLKTFDEDLIVLTGGFEEFGFECVIAPKIVRVVPVEKRFYGPSFEEERRVFDAKRVKGRPADAVVIDFQ